VRFRQLAVRILVTILWTWVGASHAATNDIFSGQGPVAMAIDIKPDDPENIIRASSSRVVSVAIFGSGDLDVTAINPRTIRLNGVNIMLVGKSDKSLCDRPTDINDDSYEDLVCDVRTTGFKVGLGEYKVILKAATYHAESLLGEDRIKIVGN
jgi:hypothetical protein